MKKNCKKPKNLGQRGAQQSLRKCMYVLMRIILVILQLLVVAAHGDKHAWDPLRPEVCGRAKA